MATMIPFPSHNCKVKENRRKKTKKKTNKTKPPQNLNDEAYCVSFERENGPCSGRTDSSTSFDCKLILYIHGFDVHIISEKNESDSPTTSATSSLSSSPSQFSSEQPQQYKPALSQSLNHKEHVLFARLTADAQVCVTITSRVLTLWQIGADCRVC
eukprot:m.7128 g.7128  ORF g.7128 m.7128 type:complete len:156 (-) comp5660_c0_seq1:2701-3168(-)